MTSIYSDGGIYSTLRYGCPWVQKGVRFSRYIIKEPYKSVLCIGCGQGYEVIEYLNQGKDAYGIELHAINVPRLAGRVIIGKVPELPFKNNQFDLVHCCEVLEHIPPETTDDFIQECKRVGRNYLFSIATVDDVFDTHINVQEPDWWLEKFLSHDFHVKEYKYKPTINMPINKEEKMVHQVSFQYTDGVFIHAGQAV